MLMNMIHYMFEDTQQLTMDKLNAIFEFITDLIESINIGYKTGNYNQAMK